MTRTSNLDAWIQAAKLGAAAGELAPFPYIKGLCGCAVVVLEAIEVCDKPPLRVVSSLTGIVVAESWQEQRGSTRFGRQYREDN